jgi:hypothetical protein
MTIRVTLVCAATAAVALGACGGGDDAGGNPDAPAGTPDAGVDPGELIGGIRILEERALTGDPPQEYRAGRVHVRFYDPAPPDFHRVTVTEGACTLRRYVPASCDPACNDGLCVGDNECEPWPGMASAGTLTIAGLETAVSITPVDGYYYYNDALPDDLFADAAAITAELAGDDVSGGTLETTGVPPIETAIETKIVLDPGEDHTIAWTAGGGGRIRVTINANNQGHGGPYLGIITCEADDAAGELTIPAALIDQFPETRAWTVCAGTDCPPSSIERLRAAYLPVGDGRAVSLEVSSLSYFGVDHFPVDK